MNEELQYTIAQNKKSIKSSIADIEEALKGLKAMLDEDSFGGSKLTTWIDGYVARDISKVSALLSRQAALIEVSTMIESKVK